MNAIQRALRYVGRKWTRTLLMCLLLFSISMGLLLSYHYQVASLGEMSALQELFLSSSESEEMQPEFYDDDMAKAYQEQKEQELQDTLTKDGVDGQLQGLQTMMKWIFIGLIAFSAFILTLALTFWVGERLHETGVLLSVGISKWNILRQYLLEVFVYIGIQFGFVAVFAMFTAITWKSVGVVVLAEICVATLAVSIASIGMFRLKPREILSKMS